MRRLVVKKTLEAFLNSAAPNFLGARPSFVDDYRKSMGWMILHELSVSLSSLERALINLILSCI